MEHAAQSAVATSHVQNLRIQAILQGVEHIPRSPWQIHGNLREICEISMKIYGKPMGDLGEIYGNRTEIHGHLWKSCGKSYGTSPRFDGHLK